MSTKKSLRLANALQHRAAVFAQLESYFSDDVFEHDEALQALAKIPRSGGWIKLSAILQLKTELAAMLTLNHAKTELMLALKHASCTRGSMIIVCDEESRRVRKRTFHERVLKEIEHRLSDNEGQHFKDLQLAASAERNDGYISFADLYDILPTLKRLVDNEAHRHDGWSDAERTKEIVAALVNSRKVEVSPEEGKGVRRVSLMKRLRLEIEHIFRNVDPSLVIYFLEHDNRIPIAELLHLPALRSIVYVPNGSESIVAECLQDSELVEVVDDGTAIVPIRYKLACEEEDGGQGGVAVREHAAHLGRQDSLGSVYLQIDSPTVSQKGGFSPISSLVHEDVVALFEKQNSNEPKVSDWLLEKALLATTRELSKLNNQNGVFGVLTFNLLADALTKEKGGGSSNYPFLPDELLSWDYRRQRIETALVAARADIVCLQELQATIDAANEQNHAAQMISFLSGHGYEHCYESKALLKNGCANIGNGLFWRSEVWQNITPASPSGATCYKTYFDSEIAWRFTTEAAQRARYSTFQTQRAVAVLLQHRVTGKIILAVTTHLSCSWKQVDVQLTQAVYLTQWITRLLKRNNTNAKQTPVILCGDFNSVPNETVHNFMTKGTLLEEGSEVLPEVVSALLHPSDLPPPHLAIYDDPSGPVHELDLQSAYAHVSPNNSEPAYTCCGTPAGRDLDADLHEAMPFCLDYIFFTREAGLVPIASGQVPSADILTSEVSKGLPNSICPSDHLPLHVMFKIEMP